MRSLEATGGVDAATPGHSAARAAAGDAPVGHGGPAGLAGHDCALGLLEGGAPDAEAA